MPELVVNRFESVEIDEDHRHRPAVAPRGSDGTIDFLLDQGAVGEAGQLVVQAQPLELSLETKAKEGLGGVPAQRLLEFHELVVEGALPSNSADEDAHRDTVFEHRGHTQSGEMRGLHRVGNVGSQRPDLSEVTERQDLPRAQCGSAEADRANSDPFFEWIRSSRQPEAVLVIEQEDPGLDGGESHPHRVGKGIRQSALRSA